MVVVNGVLRCSACLAPPAALPSLLAPALPAQSLHFWYVAHAKVHPTERIAAYTHIRDMHAHYMRWARHKHIIGQSEGEPMTLCACFITPMRSECSHVKLLFDVVWGCKLCAAATKSVDVAASKKWTNYFPGLVNVSAPENKKVHFLKIQLCAGQYLVMPPLHAKTS